MGREARVLAERTPRWWIAVSAVAVVAALSASPVAAAPITVSATPNYDFANGSTTNFLLFVPVDSALFDVNVSVHVEYPRPADQTACTGSPPPGRIDDMTITLISPDGGQPVELASSDGGTAEILDVTFNDEASTSITGLAGTNCETISGPYKPEQALSALDGTQMLGTWRLRISDSFNGSTGGTLKSWSLTFRTTWIFVDGFESGNRGSWDDHNP